LHSIVSPPPTPYSFYFEVRMEDIQITKV
jgi:hypothetical protein